MKEIAAYITLKFEGSLPINADGLLDAIRNELDRQPGIEFRSTGIELRKGWDDRYREAIEKHRASWQDEGEISVSEADQELWAFLDREEE